MERHSTFIDWKTILRWKYSLNWSANSMQSLSKSQLYFAKIDKPILIFKRSRVTKTTLQIKNKVVELILSDLET